MTPKERILAENQAEAARRLEDLKAHGADRSGDGNFTGIYEDQGELIIRTSTGEISMEDYEELYGDPSRNWSADRKLEEIEAESRFEEKLEQQNALHSSDEAQDQDDYVVGSRYRDEETGEIVYRTSSGDLTQSDYDILYGEPPDLLEHMARWREEFQESRRHEEEHMRRAQEAEAQERKANRQLGAEQ